MKFIFISVGKKSDANIGEIITDFTERVSRYVKVEWKIISSSDIQNESKEIIEKTSDGEIVLLDEVGKELSTEDLADLIQKKMISGTKNVYFIIGGAYGVSDELKSKANFIWSLSKLTFPHQIVRLLLAESVYRAFTVINNEKYHHRQKKILKN